DDGPARGGELLHVLDVGDRALLRAMVPRVQVPDVRGLAAAFGVERGLVEDDEVALRPEDRRVEVADRGVLVVDGARGRKAFEAAVLLGFLLDLARLRL